MISCEFREISKNTFSDRKPLVNASEQELNQYYQSIQIDIHNLYNAIESGKTNEV